MSLLFAVPIAMALRVFQLEESITCNYDDVDLSHFTHGIYVPRWIFAVADGETISYTKPFCDNINLTWDQMKQYRYTIVLFQVNALNETVQSL